MTHEEQRKYLIGKLLKEQPGYANTKFSDIGFADAAISNMAIPDTPLEQSRFLRSLFNIRMPGSADEDFIRIQDEYLKAEMRDKGITELSELSEAEPGIYLWQGDITTLKADAIVNAANSQMLGCFCPCHGCIDNAIHTYAGIQLRNECNGIMEEKRRLYGADYEEPTGAAIITEGYNLPCRYVIHTVGPIIYGRLTEEDCMKLASCYTSCLELAEEKGLGNIAFCCISTGEFHFPNDKAARIAVDTVRKYRKEHNGRLKVVFNVFKDIDYEIYREILGEV